MTANRRELAESAVASFWRNKPVRVNSCPFVVRKSSQKNKIPSYSSAKEKSRILWGAWARRRASSTNFSVPQFETHHRGEGRAIGRRRKLGDFAAGFADRIVDY